MGLRESIRTWFVGSNGHAATLKETTDLDSTFIDPRDALRGEDGEAWIPLGAGGGYADTQERAGIGNERELADVRGLCRYLARKSAYCIGAHQARISYVVGTGHKYTVVAKQGQELSEEAISGVQAVLDEWLWGERWHKRQQEILLRRDRDGEAFLRKFIKPDGLPTVRFVEPGQVSQPDRLRASDAGAWGIDTDPADVETVLGYWVDGQLVDATEIQHRKGQVDCNVRRGCPLFWPVVETLHDSRRVNRNMARGSMLQTSVGYIRKLPKATATSQATTLRSNAAEYTRSNYRTGQVEYLEQHRAGRILTVPGDMEYEFPFASTRYDQYVQVVQSNLREVASMLQMPEFMLTADASNANYSSTLVAEGPSVKNFERLQQDQVDDDLAILWWVLETLARQGKVPESLLSAVEIQATRPQIVSRDKAKEATVAVQLMQAGVLSPQTMAAQFGLDYAQEQTNIEDHRERVEGASGVEPMEPEDDEEDMDDMGESCGTGAGGFKRGNT